MKGTKVQTLAMRLHFSLLTSNEDVNSHVVDVYITCNEKYVKKQMTGDIHVRIPIRAHFFTLFQIVSRLQPFQRV